MLQNATFPGNQHPDPPNLMVMSLLLRLPRDTHLRRSSSGAHACHILPLFFCKCCKTFAFCVTLARCRINCACLAKPHTNFKKVVRHRIFWDFKLEMTTACAFGTSHFFENSEAEVLSLKHRRVHLLGSATSSHVPTMR